jgi:transcriptional regulator GlxA family with amidase domain
MDDQPQPVRTIGFLVFPDFQILDLTGPLAVFEMANAKARTPIYRLRIISREGGTVPSTSGLVVATEPVGSATFDTVVVVGGEGSHAAAGDPVQSAVISSLARCTRRMTSICTGAFLLAGAGLLDGRKATTHWRYVARLQREHPAVQVQHDPIFVRDGQVWSSAGVTAGIDLAMALVEEDLGFEASQEIARELVIFHRRSGGQSQFSTMLELEPSSDRIRRVLAYAREHLTESLSVASLAEVACLSERQFGRAFRAETGETPARAVERLRTEAARIQLESGTETVEAVGAAVGFSDPERMRRAFLRVYGMPPQALRRAARARRA